jgi:acetoin utilization deacetylase AcuC-like enzyme
LIAAIGADAHETDPLSSLRISTAAYGRAGELLGGLAAELDVPILIGGAGGYQPESVTPRIWADVVTNIAIKMAKTQTNGTSQ